MNCTVHITVGGVAYDLEIDDFTRGTSGSYFDPPESGEVEIADEVTFDGGTITLEQLIALVAAERGISLEQAASIVFDTAYEQAERYYDDLCDDVAENERRYDDE